MAALILVSLFLLVLLPPLGSIEIEPKPCPYKRNCSPFYCPYWNKCKRYDKNKYY